jgi:hypothetical protein
LADVLVQTDNVRSIVSLAASYQVVGWYALTYSLNYCKLLTSIYHIGAGGDGGMEQETNEKQTQQ